MTTDPQPTLTIGALTDEELAALATTEGLSVFPVLGTLPPEHRDIAVRTAYRSLVARGVLEAPSAQEEADAVARAGDGALLELPVRMPESLRHVLALRAGAQHVVAVSRATALGEEYRYAYAVDDVVLEEHVTASGLHTFALSAADDLPETLTGWALHAEAADGSGDAVSVDPTRPEPPAELLEALGSALLRADVVLRSAGDQAPVVRGVFSGPGGTWLATATLGSGEPVLARPLAVDAVRGELAAALTELRFPA